MRKICPKGPDSRSLTRWFPDPNYQKQKRLDGNEGELVSIKRRMLDVLIGITEVQDKPFDREDPDISQIPPHITPSEALLGDTGLDDEGMPELTYSNSTPSLEEDNFRSIDDFPIDNIDLPIKPPEPFELFNEPSIAQASRYEARLLEEEALFSQYLRSPSPECSGTKVISHEVGKRFESVL